jgi:hypothetical protein
MRLSASVDDDGNRDRLISNCRLMTCLNPTAERFSAVGTKQITTSLVTDGAMGSAQLHAKINSYE